MWIEVFLEIIINLPKLIYFSYFIWSFTFCFFMLKYFFFYKFCNVTDAIFLHIIIYLSFSLPFSFLPRFYLKKLLHFTKYVALSLQFSCLWFIHNATDKDCKSIVIQTAFILVREGRGGGERKEKKLCYQTGPKYLKNDGSF